MIDIASITAAVSSLKAAGEIAVSIVSLKTMAEVQTTAIELNQKLIAAQHSIFAAHAAQTALVERVRDLETQIAKMEAWETQMQRYQMMSPSGGAIIYALKRTESNGEPPHFLCPNCYENGRRSILQNVYSEGWGALKCQVTECGAVIRVNRGGGPVTMQYAE